MTDRQCPSCGGFCSPRGCERENDKPAPIAMSGWKLVPVEPTEQMLDAMQTAGIAAFDADVAASLGDTPLDPTHARRAIWQAALDAAPEAPSAEPVAWVIYDQEFNDIEWSKAGMKLKEGTPLYTHPPSAADRFCDDNCTWADHAPGCKYAPSAEPCPYIRSSGTGEWATHWCSLNGPPDHREVMRQALEALEGCDDRAGLIQHKGQWVSRRMAAIAALRAALGEKG